MKPAIASQPIDVEICSNPKDANGLVDSTKIENNTFELLCEDDTTGSREGFYV